MGGGEDTGGNIAHTVQNHHSGSQKHIVRTHSYFHWHLESP